MKKILILLLLIGSAYGQSPMGSIAYSTDFATSSTGYVWTTNGSGMGPVIDERGYWACLIDGQDGWVSNQDYYPQAYGPGLNEYVSSYKSGYWTPTFAAIGGDTYNSTSTGDPYTYPQNITNNWMRFFDNNTNSVYFQSKFAVNATSPNTNNQWDTFAFTLLNKNTNALFSINLNAVDVSGEYWQITYSSYANNGVTNVPLIKANGTPLANLENMQLAYLGFDVLDLGTANQKIVMYNTFYTNSMGLPTVLGTNAILGSDFSGIDTDVVGLAATWTIRDTTSATFVDGTNVVTVYPGYADNTLLIQNVTVAVPEPHIIALLVIAIILIIILKGRI